jgi:hypothetical protein
MRIGTLPPVGAFDRLRGANGDGMIERARSNPRLLVAIAAGAILLLAWIGWAIYVTGENGADAGLGVVIAWPAMLAALALISLPFIGGYLLVKRLSAGEGSTATAESDSSEDDDEEDEEESDDAPEDSAEDENPAEEEDESDEEDDEGEEDDEDDSDEESDDNDDDDDDSESDPEAKAAKS